MLAEEDDLFDAVVGDYRQQMKASESLAFGILRDASSPLHDDFVARSHLVLASLQKLPPEPNDKAELFAFCRNQYRDDTIQLQTMSRFEQTYDPQFAIHWYTVEGFVYQMVNKALRTHSIHLLYLYRFFIVDLIRQLRQRQCKTAVNAYRGQYLSDEELVLLEGCIGKMISINSFLSTSARRDVALGFIGDQQVANDLHKVLFEIDAVPRESMSKPFADISDASAHGYEAEVLFSANSIFRIESIRMDADEVHIIRLTLCDDDEPEVRRISNFVASRCPRERIDLLDFPNILFEMTNFKDADFYYRYCLHMGPQGSLEICTCYDRLGSIAFARNDFAASLQWHEKALHIRSSVHKPRDAHLASSHFNVGLAQEKLRKFADACRSFECASQIWKLDRAKHGTHLARSYRKLGQLSNRAGKYASALKYYQKVHRLWTHNNVPTNDARLGELYYDLGRTYQHLNRNDAALKNYELALKSYQKCVAMHHLSVAMVFEKIAFIHHKQKSFIQARLYYEKALEICRQSFATNHPYLLQLQASIARIQTELRDDPTTETL